MTTPQDVLDFWFDADPTTHREVWFARTDAFDAACARFTGDVRLAREGALDGWAETPRGALALVILLDQFSRNLFRGSPETYAADAKARSMAREAVARGFDQQVGPVERTFFYMPFMHSEDIVDQEEGVRLFAAMGDEQVRYAHHHHDVIRRFGRFPHRNAILGRSSSAEEIAFLAEPDKEA